MSKLLTQLDVQRMDIPLSEKMRLYKLIYLSGMSGRGKNGQRIRAAREAVKEASVKYL